MLEKYPTVTNFKCLNHWFDGFYWRNRLSLCQKTHVSQKAQSHLKPAVQKFHLKLLQERKHRTFALCDIANMDQTPLPFVLDNKRTYNAKGFEEVRFSSSKSGLR